MGEFFKRLRLAYLKWRNPLKEDNCPTLDTSTALEKYEPQPGYVVRPQPSVEDLAKAYVRQEFERLVREASHEQVRVDIADVARPDAESTEHRWRWDWEGKAGREWQSVALSVDHEGMLRVVAGTTLEQPIFLTLVAHRTTPIEINISSLLYASAEYPVTVWCFSSRPFTVKRVMANIRLDAEVIRRFREEMLEKEGFVASLPAQDSVAGRAFYSDRPDLIP